MFNRLLKIMLPLCVGWFAASAQAQLQYWVSVGSYQDVDRAQEALQQATGTGDGDYFDIPAFLRRQAD